MTMNTREIKEWTSVQAHISMMQGMIGRMANNSANCKLWCVTILAASVALFIEGKAKSIEYCYFITVLFYSLDCFYLGLERQFVSAQNSFVDKINKGGSEVEIAKQIFVLDPLGVNSHTECRALRFCKRLWQTLKALISFSTTPFYGAILYVIYYIQNSHI